MWDKYWSKTSIISYRMIVEDMYGLRNAGSLLGTDVARRSTRDYQESWFYSLSGWERTVQTRRSLAGFWIRLLAPPHSRSWSGFFATTLLPLLIWRKCLGLRHKCLWEWFSLAPLTSIRVINGSHSKSVLHQPVCLVYIFAITKHMAPNLLHTTPLYVISLNFENID